MFAPINVSILLPFYPVYVFVLTGIKPGTGIERKKINERFNWIKKYLFDWTKIVIFLFLKQLFSIHYVQEDRVLS